MARKWRPHRNLVPIGTFAQELGNTPVTTTERYTLGVCYNFRNNTLRVSFREPVSLALHLRLPGWLTAAAEVKVNAEPELRSLRIVKERAHGAFVTAR
jgi:hypothetical protein